MNLSTKQKAVVDHVDGALLVKAEPGTGKTRVLTERVKRLLSLNKRGRILALTLSNVAAEKIRSRLDSDTEVVASIGRVRIETIHSFCRDLVQSRGYLIGLLPDVSSFESENDRVAILREAIADAIADEPLYGAVLGKEQKPEEIFKKYLSLISEQKRSLISPELCDFAEPFPSIYRKYNDVLLSQNAIDFDDILFFAYRILTENLAVAKLYNSIYHYICIDESQDLNKAQYNIINALCCSNFNNIMMVGDENQAIYSFNGSSSKYMSNLFVHKFKPTIYILDDNFRSAKQIIKFSNSLTGNTEDISKYFYEGELSVNSFANELSEAQAICAMIENLISNGHKDIENSLRYDDFAIIARNKYVFSQIENEFTAKKIPFYYKKTPSGIICETTFMKAFDLILRLIMNPMDLYHRQILYKISSQQFSEASNINDKQTSIEKILQPTKFAWLNSALPHLSVGAVFNFNKALATLKENMPSDLSDDDRYLLEKDIDEWRKHWNKYKSQISRENRSLISFRNAISLGKTQEIDAKSGVVLLTAHMSKGLEFEVVFVIGLTEGTFPDYRAVNSINGEA
ncbi:MAG: ATP-dependent helicase, partial [Bacteroidales bacterium]|nr:ATP-dependent helicase [Bacteroidales bacterium]